MTNPIHDHVQDQAQQPGTGNPDIIRQVVIEDLHAYLTDGMPVYDRYGRNVGHVKMYNIAVGYLMVGCGVFEHHELYIPFRLIRSIDPHSIFVSETKDALISQCAEQPPIDTVVEHRLVPDPDGPIGTMTWQTREVQLVPSGYDGTPVAFNSVDLSTVVDRLALGMVIYDARGARLGDITECDTSRGLMVVEKGIFKPKGLIVPFGAIKEIHPGTGTVYLSLPREALVLQHALLPADI